MYLYLNLYLCLLELHGNAGQIVQLQAQSIVAEVKKDSVHTDLQLGQSLLVIMLCLVKLHLQLESLAIQIPGSTLKPGHLLAGLLQLFLQVSHLLLQALKLLQGVTGKGSSGTRKVSQEDAAS